jgi:hypothetical protein
VLLTRRWVVERSFGWVICFLRLARDYEHLSVTLTGLHFIVFVTLLLTRAVPHFLKMHDTLLPEVHRLDYLLVNAFDVLFT